jgi:putative transposase
MAMRTITLKLHKPGARKRRIIDEAIYNYSRAYQYLLDKARKDIDNLRKNYKDEKGRYRTTVISKWVDKNTARELNRFDIEPFKDSLIMDFGMTMASYLALKELKSDAGFPVAYISPGRWEQEYEQIFSEFEKGQRSEAEFEKIVSKMAKKSETLKPLFFCRYDTKRDYCLLYDEMKNRYYVKLYLMNARSENRKEINCRKDRVLRYIFKGGKELESSRRKERYLLVPLSFGKWQEAYLKKALENPSILKTARLSKKGEEYYLSISVDIGDCEAVKTENYLGVSRGIKNVLNFAVVNREGEISDKGGIELEKTALKFCPKNGNALAEGGKISSGDLHKLANMIVEKALESKAQVIVESLIDRGDLIKWEDENGRLCPSSISCYAYNRIVEILDYKLPGAGLPPPVKVSPAGIFYTCPNCGLRSKDNRFSKDLLICIACGTAAAVEEAGSLNLSKKLIKYKKEMLKIKVKRMPEGMIFLNEDIGLEFAPTGTKDFLQEFKEEIRRMAEDLKTKKYVNRKDKGFRKKYSLIKKLEECENFSDIIELEI